MEKIPSLLERDFSGGNAAHSPVTGRINPEASWALTDEGVVARRKWDGTCVLVAAVDNGLVVRTRRMVRDGAAPPPGFVPAERDERTGKTFGWEPSMQSSYAGPLNEAIDRFIAGGHVPQEGTYELIGPKVQNNAEHLTEHRLERHDTATPIKKGLPRDVTPDIALEYACSLVEDLHRLGWEGLVFYHPDGRRAKLKARDVAELRTLRRVQRDVALLRGAAA